LAINKLRFFLQLIKSNHFAIFRQKDKHKVSQKEKAWHRRVRKCATLKGGGKESLRKVWGKGAPAVNSCHLLLAFTSKTTATETLSRPSRSRTYATKFAKQNHDKWTRPTNKQSEKQRVSQRAKLILVSPLCVFNLTKERRKLAGKGQEKQNSCWLKGVKWLGRVEKLGKC